MKFDEQSKAEWGLPVAVLAVSILLLMIVLNNRDVRMQNDLEHISARTEADSIAIDSLEQEIDSLKARVQYIIGRIN